MTYTFANNTGLTTGQTTNLLTIIDRNNNTLSLSYNNDTTLNTVSDALGRQLSFSYNAATANISAKIKQINVIAGKRQCQKRQQKDSVKKTVSGLTLLQNMIKTYGVSSNKCCNVAKRQCQVSHYYKI